MLAYLLLTFALALQPQQDRGPLGHQLRYESGCLILDVQGGIQDPPPLPSSLDRYLTVELPGDTNSVELYAWAALSLVRGFEIARDGHRAVGGANIRGRSVRIVVVPNGSLTAAICSDARTPGHIEIFFTTGLIDVVEGAVRASLADVQAEIETGTHSSDGFVAWMNSIQALSGRAVPEPRVPFPAPDYAPNAEMRKVIDKTLSDLGVPLEELNPEAKRYLLTASFSMTAYAFIMAHELAHISEGPSDGSIDIEQRCDKLAFRACRATEKFMPDMTLRALVALRDYSALFEKIVLQTPLRAPSGSEVLAAHAWDHRAKNLLTLWEGGFDSDRGNPMYLPGWRAAAAEVRAHLERPSPRPARLGDSDDSSSKYLSLRIGSEGVEWNKEWDDRSVKYQYRIYNTHPTATIDATVDIISGYAPRDETSGNYREHSKSVHRVVLGPGEHRDIVGVLEWWRDADSMPVLREEIAGARFLGFTPLEAGNPSVLREILAGLAAATENGLGAVQRELQRQTDRYEYWSTTESIPGMEPGTITVSRKDGRRRLKFRVATVEDSISPADGKQLYEQWIADLTQALPEGWTTETDYEKTEDGEEWDWDADSPRNDAHFRLNLEVDTDDSSVDLTLTFWEPRE